MSHPNVETAESLAIPGLSAERRAAARDAWAAFWSSRAIVWGAGMAAILIFGWASEASARLDPLYTTPPYTDPFAHLPATPPPPPPPPLHRLVRDPARAPRRSLRRRLVSGDRQPRLRGRRQGRLLP